MNKKQLIVAWIIGALILSGCSNFTLEGAQAKFSIPFDFPQVESDTNK
jgi:outer membrane murein-binding lipoprotein Lpp